jgi:hypothetical protein
MVIWSMKPLCDALASALLWARIKTRVVISRENDPMEAGISPWGSITQGTAKQFDADVRVAVATPARRPPESPCARGWSRRAIIAAPARARLATCTVLDAGETSEVECTGAAAVSSIRVVTTCGGVVRRQGYPMLAITGGGTTCARAFLAFIFSPCLLPARARIPLAARLVDLIYTLLPQIGAPIILAITLS